jgi:parallel beta-helix repeat protein
MKRFIFLTFRVGLALSLLLLPVPRPALAAPQAGGGTFTVNTANDSNTRLDTELSLREAIQIANGTLIGPFSLQEKSQMVGCTFNASNFISNACGGGNNTIQFSPALTEVTLDGRLDLLSAAGVTIDGQVTGGRVVVNSSVADLAFWIGVDNTTVKNITVINATNPIGVASNLAIKGLKIFNAYLGVVPGLASCTSAPIVRQPDFAFILFKGSGTAAPGDGTAYLYNNVLGCAVFDGIALSNVSFVYIGEDANGIGAVNWIGLDPAGHALPNGNSGISLCCGTNVKGNSVVNNYIANNFHHGVFLQLTDPASVNTISGNEIHHNQMAGIKLEASGANTLVNNILHDNGSSGIWLSGAFAANNTISGGASYANGAAGITEGQGAAKNTWSNLSTHDNFGLGIDKGDNGQVDAPPLTIDSVINSSGVTTVSGAYTGTMVTTSQYRIDLYRLAYDPTGYGEGRSLVGSATLNNIPFPVVNTWHIVDVAGPGCYTAVVTVISPLLPSDNNSSEFSKDFACRAFLPVVKR